MWVALSHFTRLLYTRAHPSRLHMGHTLTHYIDDLRLGDCIYTPVSIALEDLVTQGSVATRCVRFSANTIFSFDGDCRVRKGRAVERIAEVVLRCSPETGAR
jgi:hypothetical protein